MTAELKQLSSAICFDGEQQRWQHFSQSNQCTMTFGVFIPPLCTPATPMPVLYWLSGLTCNDENFVQKAGAQRIAAELGLILVTPDTSPRGDEVPDDSESSWDFGSGAGFYVDATEAPWNKHYHMYSYVTQELPALISTHFPAQKKSSIFGHSMGGHGALVCALNNPDQYKSASAFAPIVHPSACPWGEKALGQYLGNNTDDWRRYDTCELIKTNGVPLPVQIDQGLADNFLDKQLRLEDLKALAKSLNTTDSTAMTDATHLYIDEHEGYDHSYFFIASFIEKHLRFHAQHLKNN